MGFFLTLLLASVLFVVAEIIRPPPEFENAKPAGLGDFHFPTATEGRHVPLIWGTVLVDGPNVVWYGDLLEDAIEVEVDTGLFSSDDQIIGFKYYVGVQVAFCRGPGVSLLRMWIGDVEAFAGVVTGGGSFSINKPNLFGGDDRNGGFQAQFNFFEGTETQAVDSYLATQTQSVTNARTPAYRGTCYMVTGPTPGGFGGNRAYVGNSTSIKPWKVELQRIPAAIAAGNPNGGLDTNPVNVLYEIMTNTDWGLGQDPSLIDASNFLSVGTILTTEGNGFSFVLDRPLQAVDLIRQVEEQIDGVLFFDGESGKWKINLARADYDPMTIPEINSGNMRKLVSFSRMSWEDTTNQVRVAFQQRDDDYKETFGTAQDLANVRVQNGVNVSVTQSFPGVKDQTLANSIAWRSLRSMSYPLAKAEVVVDRSFHGAKPANVFAFTDADLGITRLPMRVSKVDLGRLDQGEITLHLVQDVFFFQVGAFGDPPGSGWVLPGDNLLPFPADEQLGFEAPRAFCQKDGKNPGLPDRIWGSGQRQDSATQYEMVERHAAGTPSGAFSGAGDIFAFMKIGTLTNALDAGTSIPTATIEIAPWPGLTQTDIEAAFKDNPNIVTQGTKLSNLVLVGSEFMFVRSAANSGGSNVNMENVYRAAMDSVQADHLTGASVYLIFVGGGISNTQIPATDNVHMKLLPESRTDKVDESAAAQIAFTMANRFRRPYAPPQISLDDVVFNTTASLEGVGSDGEDFGIDLDVVRRDYRSGDLNGDELDAILTDAAVTFPDYPTANNSEHDVDVRDDPDGLNTFLFTDTDTPVARPILRIDILRQTNGVLPTRMRFVLRHRHDDNAVTYTSRQELTWDFNVTSALSGQFAFGALDTNVISNTYTVDAAGDHVFTLSSAFATTGDVESSVNGAGFVTLIAQGGTTGTLVGLSISDTVRIRHTSTDTGALKHIDMAAPGAGTDAFGVLFV